MNFKGMKRGIIVFMMLVFGGAVSFGQSWCWGREGITTISGWGDGFGVAADTSHNGIICGELDYTTGKFGSNILGATTGNYTYTVKYDPNGNVLWANQSKNPNGSDNSANSVTTDIPNNVIVTGNFYEKAIFNTDTLVDPHSTGEIFVVKYNKSGSLLWAKNSVSNSRPCIAYSSAVSSDETGNIFITGSYYDTVYFDTSKVTSHYSTTPSVFTVKYDTSGNVLWARQSSIFGAGSSIANDPEGNVYVSGDFQASITFGPYVLSGPSGIYNPFIVKYDLNGNIKWIKSGSSIATASSTITCDKKGNVYMAGDFSDTIKFNSLKLYSKKSAIYLVKYDSNGNLLFAKQSENLDTNNWFAFTLSSDKYNNIYLSGGGEVEVVDGNMKIKFGTDTLAIKAGSGSTASIVYEFDSNGNVLRSSIFQDGLDGAGDGNQIASDPTGENVYVAGDIEYYSVFNIDTLGPKNGMTEYPFIAKWSCNNIETNINAISNNPTSISLFPNPNPGKFTIAFGHPELVSGTQTTLEIYNVLGERVFKQILRSAQDDNLIDISNQPNGVYLYRVLTKGGNLIGEGKIIVSK